MLDIEFCMRNSEGDVVVEGNSISISLKDKNRCFDDRYYRVIAIRKDKIVLDNDIVLGIEEIDNFSVLRLQK